jgi:hypothetical protein
VWIWAFLARLFWRRFLNYPTPFVHFCDYIPFHEDLGLDLYNLRFPWPKDDLYQVWLILAFWFWRRRFFFLNFQWIFTFSLLTTLVEGDFPSFVQFWIPFAQGRFCQLWLKLAQRFWRSWKCKRLTDRRQTDDGQQPIRKAHSWAFSSSEIGYGDVLLWRALSPNKKGEHLQDEICSFLWK